MMDGKLPRERAVLWKIVLCCLISALGNIGFNSLVSGVLKVSLYMDTVFTVAAAFAFGLWPGVLTGALLYPAGDGILYNVIFNTRANTFWPTNVFILCTISEILLVCFFRVKIRPGQSVSPEEPSFASFIGIAAQLMVLAALDCIIISVIGGIIDFVLHGLLAAPKRIYPEDIFKLGLYRNNVPVLAAAILSRIPINIVDRFIAVFAGYGISLVYRKYAAPCSRRR
ncbi:MAG: hypothetical protein LBP76_12220 [Treponema sp.]|jgi:hypothetical protein|nr:hypothetical protein [Treponema sp.]